MGIKLSKTKVAVLFGGRSGEHEVSRKSAYTVAKALSSKYQVFMIGISKEGLWYGPIPLNEIEDFESQKYLDQEITILANPQSRGLIYRLPDLETIFEAEVFFPVLHGPFGEDGTIQGLLELASVPYVGSGVSASSAAMDKVIMKNLFAQAKIPQVPYLSYLRDHIENDFMRIIKEIEITLDYPCFVKPANLGSSVGISKATHSLELIESLRVAGLYDRKVIIEKGICAREIEVSVLGNDELECSLPGEIIPSGEFYDYKAKYIDDSASLIIPASLEEEQIKLIQDLAKRAYKALGCSGLSRVDFFIDKETNQILVNEVNTMPGFTSISMYPKLWEYSGIDIEALTDRLVQLALERYKQIGRNLTSYQQ